METAAAMHRHRSIGTTEFVARMAAHRATAAARPPKRDDGLLDPREVDRALDALLDERPDDPRDGEPVRPAPPPPARSSPH